ncbi:hypothetical protein GCM10010423_19990 [Streptomyces levis]|uniref:Uncharacterized protein n=1 Tax=Streptomyces levis TaxID=285566 RepID=A0ABP6AWT4_9ACTN
MAPLSTRHTTKKTSHARMPFNRAALSLMRRTLRLQLNMFKNGRSPAPDTRTAPDGEEPSGAVRPCGEGYASSDVITCLIRV